MMKVPAPPFMTASAAKPEKSKAPCGRTVRDLWVRPQARAEAGVKPQFAWNAELPRLKAFYIDCGEKDQFNLLYGARRFVRRQNELGIPHRYEEFANNHSGVDYRMDGSLPFLVQALSGDAGH